MRVYLGAIFLILIAYSMSCAKKNFDYSKCDPSMKVSEYGIYLDPFGKENLMERKLSKDRVLIIENIRCGMKMKITEYNNGSKVSEAIFESDGRLTLDTITVHDPVFYTKKTKIISKFDFYKEG